jgi:hypothetical protein
MSQDLLLDLNDVGVSEYKSIYSIEDQSKMDFINLLEPKVALLEPKVALLEPKVALLEERIMNKVNKLFVKKDEEIGALIDIISLQKDEIIRLDNELNFVKGELLSHRSMTDGKFETLTEKIDDSCLSIRRNDIIVKGLYNVYQEFEYGMTNGRTLFMNIFTNHIIIDIHRVELSVRVFRLKLQYIKFNARLSQFETYLNQNMITLGFNSRDHDIIQNKYKDLFCKAGIIDFNLINIVQLILLFGFDKIVDNDNKNINIKDYVVVNRIIDSEHFKLLKNALIECGYITI